jgi:solute carrier family 35, member C2
MDDIVSKHRRRRSSSLASPILGNGSSSRHNRRKTTPQPGGDENDDDAHSSTSSRSGSLDYELDEIDEGSGLEDDEETGLTQKDRRRRRRRKDREMRMDERVAGSPDIKERDEEREASLVVIRKAVINACLIGLW